jgi:hypothetical protein
MNITPIDRRFYIIAAAAVILNAIAWVIAWLFPHDESTAILHYTSQVGIDFVGEGRHILVLPAIGLILLGLNLLAGRLIMSADKRTPWVLWSATPIIQILLIMALLFLRSVNPA